MQNSLNQEIRQLNDKLHHKDITLHDAETLTQNQKLKIQKEISTNSTYREEIESLKRALSR